MNHTPQDLEALADLQILDMKARVAQKEKELSLLKAELERAQKAAHPFKIGEELEAHTYVTAKRRYDWQRAKLVNINFHNFHGGLSIEYRVVFLKKDGTWSTKPRYTSQLRKLPA